MRKGKDSQLLLCSLVCNKGALHSLLNGSLSFPNDVDIISGCLSLFCYYHFYCFPHCFTIKHCLEHCQFSKTLWHCWSPYNSYYLMFRFVHKVMSCGVGPHRDPSSLGCQRVTLCWEQTPFWLVTTTQKLHFYSASWTWECSMPPASTRFKTPTVLTLWWSFGMIKGQRSFSVYRARMLLLSGELWISILIMNYGCQVMLSP